eukprot:Gb_19623 [translate_table: standard]
MGTKCRIEVHFPIKWSFFYFYFPKLSGHPCFAIGDKILLIQLHPQVPKFKPL